MAIELDHTRRFAIACVALACALLAPRLALAHDPHAGALPLGDGRLSATAQRGAVMPCTMRFPGGGGAHRAGDWIRGGLWYPAEKPRVEGSVPWPDARISVTVEGTQRVVRANQLPSHATGEFPIRPGSAAHAYDRNPNRVTAQEVLLRLPATPLVAAAPGCVPMGMIGFALSGAAIFNAFDLAGRDAPAYEIQDACNGHPEPGGGYHYHDWSGCLPDAAGKAGGHSALVGYMLDGFGIYGPHGEGGAPVTNADLDECHGHTHEVEHNGQRTSVYHYHFTREYPYTLGCFRGSVAAGLMQRRPPPRPRAP